MKKIYLLTATFIALTYNVFAQNPTTCSAVYDDFSNPALWIHPILPTSLQSVPNFNTIAVTGGKFSFGQSRDNNMNYMYRSGIAISNTDFKAEIDFRHTSNGITAGGAGHVVLALNSSFEPFFSSTSSIGGSPMSSTPLALTPTNHQGIAVTFESDLTAAPTDFSFKVYINDAGIVTQVGTPISVGGPLVGGSNSDYFLQLVRVGTTTGLLNVYSDVARTMLINTSGLFAIPASIFNLNTVQFGTNEWQPADRMLTGKLDNLCIDNTIISLPSGGACNLVADDFTNPSVWAHPVLSPILACNTLATMTINSGEFLFLQSRDNNFNFMNRAVPTLSNTDFKADIEFTHTSNGVSGSLIGGAGHTILALNEGYKPFFSDPVLSVGSPGAACTPIPLSLSISAQKGIAITFESDLPEDPTDFYFKVYLNNGSGSLPIQLGTNISVGPAGIGGLNTTYYIRLLRTGITSGSLGIYSDVARTTLVAPINYFSLPASLMNLFVVQVGGNEWQEEPRMLTGKLDNLCISNLGSTCLTAAYSFNAGDATDDFGSNDGIVNGATLTTDRFGTPNSAYHFDGSLSQYIRVPSNASNNFGTTDFSVAFWMLIDPTNGSDGVPFSKHITGSFNGFTVGTNVTNPGYCNGAGTFTFYSASGGMQDACANTLLANTHNVWMHVVGTHNSATNQSKLYINNVLQTDIGSRATTGSFTNIADLIFGGLELGGTSAQAFFSGKIDEVSLYNCELNSSEIGYLFYKYGTTLAIKEVAALDKFIIAPNPTTGLITLSSQSKILKIEIFGLNGKAYQTILKNDFSTEFDFSGYESGIYLLKIITENGTSTRKIIKN